MQDDKINNDDFDDLDFEDLDDEDLDDGMDDEAPLDDDLVTDDLGDDFPEDDDFSDEDWGDEDGTADAEGKKTSKNDGQKRSSKLLVPLTAGIIIIGAGGFYVMNTIGADTNAPQEMLADSGAAPSDTGLDITEDSLPMPSPMAPPVEGEELGLGYSESTQSEDAAPADLPQDTPSDAGRAGTFAEDDVLTPMPGLQETEQDSAVPLESLGLNETSDIDDNNDIGESDANVDMEMNAASTIDNMDNNQDMALSDPPELMAEESDILGMDAQTEADSDMMESAEQEDENAFENAISAETAPVADINVEEYEERIDALENNLSEKDAAISNLTAEIKALQQQLSDKEASLEEARTTLERQEREVATESPQQAKPSSATEKPSSTAKPSSKPQTTAQTQIMPKWELRAAQPGRAYIGIIGSKDVQVVETGDTLQGIGRIESITLKDGAWVVQGTNGTIKQ